MSTLEKEIEQDNVELREKYLSEFRCYTSDEISSFASTGTNDGQDYASMWKKQNKIFCVNSDGVEVFPSFQFHAGKPLEIIGVLLTQMPDDMSAWEIAFWFSFENSYIENNQAPKDSFNLKDIGSIWIT